MRLVLVAVALVLAAVSAYFARFASTAYRGYGGAELAQLEAQYEGAAAAADPASDAGLSLYLLRQERQRRWVWPACALGAFACLVLAWRVPRGAARGPSAEEARLAAALGTPSQALEGERQKAARLLGVNADAPPEVIEAALSAQLAARDETRLDGLAPDLRKLAGEQRDALVRARDLLVSGRQRAAR